METGFMLIDENENRYTLIDEIRKRRDLYPPQGVERALLTCLANMLCMYPPGESADFEHMADDVLLVYKGFKDQLEEMTIDFD